MKKQLSFTFLPSTKLIHGGELAKGKRKVERPLKMNKPIHVVLRAKRSGLGIKQRKIEGMLQKYAEQFKIKLYRKSVNSNHIHLLIVVKRRKSFQDYLRSVTGVIAKLMGGKLWANLAFSRVANWGNEFRVLVNYVLKNQLEAHGLISYAPRTG